MIDKFLKKLIKPYNMMIFFVFISFFSWSLPNFGILRNGYTQKFSILSVGFFLIIIWYSLNFLFTFLGFNIGKKIKIKLKFPELSDKKSYLILTLITSLGMFFTIQKIFNSIDLNLLKFYILKGQANELKKILYDDYSFGLLSLRYGAIISSSVAFYKIYLRKKIKIIDLLNIFYLLFVTLIASRLSLMAAVITTITIFITNTNLKFKFFKIVISFLILFLILTFYNYSRNSNYYKKKLNQGAILSNISEIKAYTGSPFQGSISVGENYELINKNPDNWENYAKIDKWLSTNSSLLETYKKYNFFTFIIIPMKLFFISLIMGAFYRKKNTYLILSYSSYLYGYFEFWRLYFFDKGICQTLVVIPILVIVINNIFRKVK